MIEQAPSEVLRKLVEGQRFMMLTTQDDQGALVSRPMTVQEFDDDWVFRFIAQEDNAVTREADGRQVNLTVMDGNAYVSLSGTGRGISRVDRRARRARPESRRAPTAAPASAGTPGIRPPRPAADRDRWCAR